MEESDEIYWLVKFGSKEHMGKLLNEGELYFGTAKKFNESSEIERGDVNEGAEWIENAQIIKFQAKHPTLGTHEFFSVPNKLSKLTQYNYYFLSYSLLAISPRVFENSNIYKIDNRMLEFGDSAVLICSPKNFMNSVISKLNELGLKCNANLVKYGNHNNKGRIELTPFDKKMEHQHQMEFRIIIENIDNNSKSIKIGSIEKYSNLVSSKSMIESIWEAKRINLE